MMDSPEGLTTKAVARQLVADLSPASRGALRDWAQQLLTIRESNLTALRKTRLALRATYRRDVMLPLASSAGARLKDLAWDDRSWSARIGLGAAAVTAATLGTQGAGIAAMGGAIGVPLWIVFGAGGSFAGMLIDELSKVAVAPAARVVDENNGKDWEVIETGAAPLPRVDQLLMLPGSVPNALEHSTPHRDPLWQVFKRAYRESRDRQ